MAKTILKILDQVNIKFVDLDPHTRRKLVESVKFFLPNARHTPAYKLGRWDGTISFFQVSGASYLNLLDIFLPIVMKEGYEIEIEDLRPQITYEFEEIDELFLADRVWPKGHVAEGKPIMLRDYQVDAVNKYMKHQQCIQSISTGAGKTLMTATLSILAEKYGRSIIIVPSKSLVVQTEEDYVNLGLDVGVFFGERKELGRTHTICTWQSVSALFKNSKDAFEDEYTIYDMVDGVAAIIVDEVHSAKGNILKELLVGPMANIPIRIGLTGTIPKEEDAQMTLLSSLGPIVGEIRASDLQEQGVLAQCHVHAIQTDDSHVEYNDYTSESMYLTTDYKRIEWIAKLTQEIAKQGNTLILVNKIETGELLQSMIPDSTFVNGGTKNQDRVDQYKEVQTATNKVLIATYGVAAVGLNVPRLFHVIMVEPGKSFVRVIQTIGRGIRKANDKDAVDIWDLTSNMKFSAKHLTKRKEFYKDAEYPITTSKVEYRSPLTKVDDVIKEALEKKAKAEAKAAKKKED
jgi:superfamily II DNA or RNA helicase